MIKSLFFIFPAETISAEQSTEKTKKILDAPSIDQTTREGIPSSCNYIKVSSMYKGEYDWIERYARYTIYGLIILIPPSVFLYHRRGVRE